jgi:hypothetical protein
VNFDLTLFKGIKFESVAFDDYRLIMIPMFLHLPSIDHGDVVGFASTPPVIDGVKGADHFQLDVQSCPRGEMPSLNARLMTELKARYVHRVQKMYIEAGKTLQVPAPLLDFTQLSFDEFLRV